MMKFYTINIEAVKRNNLLFKNMFLVIININEFKYADLRNSEESLMRSWMMELLTPRSNLGETP